jgi:1,4-dihydroxy-2-naphthoyl-CoA hydrolase
VSLRPGFTIDFFNQLGREHLPEHLGIVVTKVEEELVCAEMPLQRSLLAPNNFLHAGAVVALADTTAGYACLAHLPEGGETFTTVELKANFMGTAREGWGCDGLSARFTHRG